MRDIDLYLVCKYQTKLHPMLTPRYCELMLADILGFEPDNMKKIVTRYASDPLLRNKNKAHALYEMGHSQVKIAELLGISQASVSQHLKTPIKYEWVNHEFYTYLSNMEFEDPWYRQKQEAFLKTKGYKVPKREPRLW